MPKNPHPTSSGVFKPVGHVLMSFATAADSDVALSALRDAGFTDPDLWSYTPSEMRDQAEMDIRNASGLASVGQGLKLVKAHLALALRGQSFMFVSTAHPEQVQSVAEVAIRAHATRAQHYSTLLIEELIPLGTEDQQTAEAPNRIVGRQTDGRDDVLGPEADA